MKPIKKCRYFLLILLLTGSVRAQQLPDSVITIETLIDVMLKENPALNFKAKSVQATKRQISQMGTLPDPKLNIGILSLPLDSYRFDQEPMTQKMIGISQMFPFFGKLGFREEIAHHTYGIKENELADLELKLINKLQRLYFKLFFNNKSREIMQKNKILVKDFVQVATTKYSTGQGIQQDILKSQVELLQIDKKLIEIGQQIESFKSGINILLNRLPQDYLGNPKQPVISEVKFSIDSLQQLAINNSPVINAQKINIFKSSTLHKLAKREYFPDIGISVNYGQRINRPDFISGLMSINIPLYAGSKQSKKVEEAKLSHQASKFAFENAVNDIKNEVKIRVDKIEKDKQILDLYKNGILPQAKQSLESAIAAYRTDKVDFITLLNNQVTLLNHEIDYYKSLSDYNINLSDLAYVCGVRSDVLVQ